MIQEFFIGFINKQYNWTFYCLQTSTFWKKGGVYLQWMIFLFSTCKKWISVNFLRSKTVVSFCHQTLNQLFALSRMCGQLVWWILWVWRWIIIWLLLFSACEGYMVFAESLLSLKSIYNWDDSTDVNLFIETCFFRLKKQLKRQKDVTLTASSLSSLFTRFMCKRAMQRKVCSQMTGAMHVQWSSGWTSMFQFHCCCIFNNVCVAASASAAEALSVMSLLSKKAVFSKDRLLATETAASYLFSLAAQNALEVDPITEHHFFKRSAFPTLVVFWWWYGAS